MHGSSCEDMTGGTITVRYENTARVLAGYSR